jgi:hypothetical protein
VGTFFEEDATRIVGQRAVGHYKPKGDAWHLWRPTAFWAGGAGLMTCVEDLYHWDQNFANNRLPRGKYLDEFLRDGALLGNRYCLDVDAYASEAEPESRRGLPADEYRGLKRRQFTGGAWGFSCAMTQFPEQQLTIVCLSNCDEIAAWAINCRIADLLLADCLQPLAHRAQTPPANEQPTVELQESDLHDKVGAYRLKNTRIGFARRSSSSSRK